MGFRAASFFSYWRSLSASCRSRSAARSESICGTSGPSRAALPGGDRRRSGDGERDGGERLRVLERWGEYDVPGGGVGTRTAD